MTTDAIDETLGQVTWPERRTQIPQVRIAVNFKCHKACRYCRPAGEGMSISALEEAVIRQIREMTTGEVIEVVRVLARHGVTDFKLTGGDPALREDIVELAAGIKSVPGVATLHLVTRHERAGSLAAQLKDAGLDLLNFSLDSLDAATWTGITRVQGHDRLISAVRDAARTGIPIKLNTVVMKGVNDQEIPALVEFAGEIGAELKLLDLIDDIGGFPGFDPREHYLDLVPVAEWLANQAMRVEVVTQAGGLGHPMPRFWMSNGAVVTVKTAQYGAYYGSICRSCPHYPCSDALMALRVTPNGVLQFCLLRDDVLIDLLGLLKSATPWKADAEVSRALDVYRGARPMDGQTVARERAVAESRRREQQARGFPLTVL